MLRRSRGALAFVAIMEVEVRVLEVGGCGTCRVMDERIRVLAAASVCQKRGAIARRPRGGCAVLACRAMLMCHCSLERASGSSFMHADRDGTDGMEMIAPCVANLLNLHPAGVVDAIKATTW